MPICLILNCDKYGMKFVTADVLQNLWRYPAHFSGDWLDIMFYLFIYLQFKLKR